MKYAGYYEDTQTLKNWAKSFKTRAAALRSLKNLKKTQSGVIKKYHNPPKIYKCPYSGKCYEITNSVIACDQRRQRIPKDYYDQFFPKIN